jgi:metal-responsive CopG/Arc/MetJ family transcriptional regulator
MRAKYATVKIPYELASKLDGYSSDLGYRSRAEIVDDAIRRFIDERTRLDEATPKANESRTNIQKNKIQP